MVQKCGLGLGAVALVLCAALAAHTALAEDVYFGNFEDDVMYGGQYILDQTAEGYAGWFDWDYSPEGETRPTIPYANPSTDYGVTTGDYSIAYQPYGGFDQGLTVHLQDLPGGTNVAAFDALLTHTELAMNVTWNNDDLADENPTWYEQYNGDEWNGAKVELVINYGPDGGYHTIGVPTTDSGNPTSPGLWDLDNYSGVHTRVVTWDYSTYLPEIQDLVDAGTLSATDGWMEFMLQTTIGNFTTPVTYYIDSWRFTGDIGVIGDYNGDGIVDAGDYTVWRDNVGGDGTSLANRDPANTGTIGEADYTSWKAHFGEGTGAGAGLALGAAGVPEPTTFVLTVMAMGLAAMFCRRAR